MIKPASVAIAAQHIGADMPVAADFDELEKAEAAAAAKGSRRYKAEDETAAGDVDADITLVAKLKSVFPFNMKKKRAASNEA